MASVDHSAPDLVRTSLQAGNGGVWASAAVDAAALAEIIDSLPVLIAFIDRDFTYRFANAAYRDWFHRSPEDVVGKSVTDLVGPIGFAERLPAMRRALAGEPTAVELYIPHVDGRSRWGECRLTPRRTETGEVDGFFLFVVESTKRRLAEDALRQSEERFRSLAQSIPVPIWMERVDGGLGFINQAYVDYVGLTHDQVLQTRWRTGVHRDDLPSVLAAIEAGRVSLKPCGMEARVMRCDGQWRWLRATMQPVFGPAGELEGYIAAAHDVTEAKQAETDLRRANAQLEERILERTRERDRLWRTSKDILVVADREGRWLDVNPAAERCLGRSRKELIGRTPEWLELPEERARSRAELLMHLAGPGRGTYENRLATRGGDIVWISWSSVHDGDLIYCIGRDVSAQKRAAMELEAAQAQLREAQKMEAIGQLTGGIAHDFNNMLTAMIGSLDLMRRKLESGRVYEVGRYITTATASAERAAALTQRLLAFSRRQALNPRPLDVNELVCSMSDLLERTLGDAIQIRTVLDGQLWTAYTDSNQLEAAILNIALNARDAMPAGGVLRIETANVEATCGTGGSADCAPGPYVLIALSDTGTGMDARVLNRVFEPFFTTKPVGQGTGLGLSMVYGFVKQSGGHVRIDSEGGSGTTVRLFLPRFGADAGAGGAQAQPTS
ncbi:hybrid sensor histidine kinase/response regulator [Chelatococcus reniformis]|uniref:histidine kinase n=1 Tax=Chelatococcus reniformis TaxID=1494448 RepID=A0A916XLU4_9HYPH|nr:PAS domain S-box protein [Chelatococcus reniformis]GGC84728.1 hypothetical protein GCM10010994_48300 [Chelatococcus reniformis]